MKSIWVIFSIDDRDAYPNFFPIGAYSSKERAVKQIEQLPVDNSVQLFELPIDTFIADIAAGGKIESNLGKLNHFHYEKG